MPDPTTPKPSFERTYRQADGEPVAAEWGWVTDLDYFDDNYRPTELVEETWQRTAVRTVWHLPAAYACGVDDCEDDAVGWDMLPGADEPVQVCDEHATDRMVKDGLGSWPEGGTDAEGADRG